MERIWAVAASSILSVSAHSFSKLYGLCMPCLACTLSSVYLVSVVFGTAIPTSLYVYTFEENFFIYLFVHFFLYNSTVTKEVARTIKLMASKFWRCQGLIQLHFCSL